MLPVNKTWRQISSFIRKLTSIRSMSRGAFIVFEGCDRSGKTTQCKKVVDALNADGVSASFSCFPDRTTAIGQVINDYLGRKVELEDHAVHLLFTANRWEAVPNMLKQLEAGTTLIVDRYAFSGVAFSAAKEGMDLAWCKEPERGLPKPDAVIYLTLTPEEAARRGAYGGERYEVTDFQERVSANYKQLMEDNWVEVDASKTVEELQTDIKSLVQNIINKSQNKPLGKLWLEKMSNGTL